MMVAVGTVLAIFVANMVSSQRVLAGVGGGDSIGQTVAAAAAGRGLAGGLDPAGG